MSTLLNHKLGESTQDDLIVGTRPLLRVGAGTIGAATEAVTLKRGTLLAKSDGKLTAAPYGGTGTPYGILCDDTEVGTDADAVAAVYLSGNFNLNKIILADGYTLSDTDLDTLRAVDIAVTAAYPAL